MMADMIYDEKLCLFHEQGLEFETDTDGKVG